MLNVMRKRSLGAFKAWATDQMSRSAQDFVENSKYMEWEQERSPSEEGEARARAEMKWHDARLRRFCTAVDVIEEYQGVIHK